MPMLQATLGHEQRHAKLCSETGLPQILTIITPGEQRNSDMGESIKLHYFHYLPHLRCTEKVKFLFVWGLFIFQCSPRKQPASSSSQIFSNWWCRVRYHQPNAMNSPIPELLPDGEVCLSFKQDNQQPCPL